jgi:hypothetical protein
MSRLIVASVLVAALVLVLAAVAPGGVTAAAKDPKSARALGKLLAAEQLGCTDFVPTSASSASGLPAGFDLLASKLEGASLGSCTIDGQQTLLVAFKTARARKRFETAVRTLPCLVIKVLEEQFTTPAPGAPAGSLSIPLVEVGSRALVFGTGTAPDTDRLDLTAAGLTDARVAGATQGKVRSYAFTCP